MSAMSAALPPLINALLDPRCYPHAVDRVEWIETHASWLLLAGDFAYKIKKQITLPFLDYGTLARREAFCRAELVLNHRLAPDLYLAVVPVGGTPERPRLGVQPAIEWAVQMRRFDENGRLDRVAARGELQPAHLSRLAGTLCAFQQAAAVAAPGTRFGAPEQVLAAARENFVELRQLLPPSGQPQVEQLASWTGAEFARREKDFAARKSGGRVREGHGDLHLGNLVLIDGQVTAFDCIEFNEDFRWNDAASEIAFVWIDLLDHRQPGLAAWLLNAWLEAGGDFQALAVLRFYAVYRAVVRAKIAALRAGQEDGGQSSAELELAGGYLQLARQIAMPPPPTPGHHLRPVRLGQDHGKFGATAGRHQRRRRQHCPSALGRRAQAPVRAGSPGRQRLGARQRNLHGRSDDADLCTPAGPGAGYPQRRLAGDRRCRLPAARRARRLPRTGRRAWRRLRHPCHGGTRRRAAPAPDAAQRRRLGSHRGRAGKADDMVRSAR